MEDGKELELHPQTRFATSPRKRSWGVQCKRVKKDGTRCRSFAISGSTVCHKHGGQLPVVRAAAKERLATLQLLALTTIHLLMNEDEKPEIRLRAAKEALRYSGINPRALQREGTVRGRALKKIEANRIDIDDEIEKLLGAIKAIEAGDSNDIDE